MKVGEFWYVKFQGATTLTKVEIVDVTEKTIAIENYREIGRSRPVRYEKTMINFIEKCGR